MCIFCVVLTGTPPLDRGTSADPADSPSPLVHALEAFVALTADSSTHLAIPRDWRDVAACRDTDPDLFFPVGTTGNAAQQIRAAKAVCDLCPAKEPCLQFAIENNQDSGVWGGTAEDERRVLRRAWVKARKAATVPA